MPADNVISFEDRKAERIEKASTVSYTAPFLIEETRDGRWNLMAEGVSADDARLFLRYAAARLGVEVG